METIERILQEKAAPEKEKWIEKLRNITDARTEEEMKMVFNGSLRKSKCDQRNG